MCDLCVLLFALEFALKPVRTELYHVIQEGLKMRRTEERAQRERVDPSSV